MKFALLIVSALFLFTGCARVQYNGGATFIKDIDYPPLNEIVTAHIGDHLVQKGSIHEIEALEVKSPLNGALYQIPAKTYAPFGHDSEYKYFDSTGVSKSVLADPFKALALETKPNGQLCVVTVFDLMSCYDGNFQITKAVHEKGNSFQQTLIYSGRIGNKINISYREFSNNIARPAFNNNVEYDLSTSNQIGYKGALIEVIKADNNSITYKVIHNFK